MLNKTKIQNCTKGFLPVVLLAYSLPALSNSTIIVDTSLPTSFNIANQSVHDLSGTGVINIDGKLDGYLVNNNLFFSFDQFGVAHGDTALFTCTDCGAISNVITRVTGGNASIIEGALTSNIPGADFWLLNPSGVLFGAGGSVDVPAAFHVSDATRLYDTNGLNYFSADLTDTQSSLNISPASFGFTGAEQAGVSLDGTTITAGENGTSFIEINGSSVLVFSSSDTPVPTNLNADNVNINSQTTVTVADTGILSVSGTLNETSSVINSGTGVIASDPILFEPIYQVFDSGATLTAYNPGITYTSEGAGTTLVNFNPIVTVLTPPAFFEKTDTLNPSNGDANSGLINVTTSGITITNATSGNTIIDTTASGSVTLNSQIVSQNGNINSGNHHNGHNASDDRLVGSSLPENVQFYDANRGAVSLPNSDVTKQSVESLTDNSSLVIDVQSD